MKLQGKIPARAKPVTAVRFSIGPTSDGYEVVDQDGRAVSPSFDRANRPLAIASDLNAAAAAGSRALTRALGAVEGAPYEAQEAPYA